MSASAGTPPLRRSGVVLADVLPDARARDVLLVLAGAGLVGLCAQIAVPLPFTPVPVTMQPFAVLLAGAALGWRRGALAMLVYAAAGVAGLPWFAGHPAGVAVVLGASFGYIVSYPCAAAAVGALARRGGDRTPLRTVGTMLVGSAIIYAVGVPWLMATLHVGLARGLALGFTPFVVSDLVKVGLAAGLLPGAWALAGRGGR